MKCDWMPLWFDMKPIVKIRNAFFGVLEPKRAIKYYSFRLKRVLKRL